MKTKICSKCKIELPATAKYFYRRKRARDGLNSNCKKCSAKANKKWRRAHRDERSAYDKQWYEKNKEYRKEKARQYYRENKEHCKKRMKRYYQENKEYLKKDIKRWKKENPEYEKERSRKRRKENKQLRLSETISNAIRGSLKKGKGGRHWEDLVGYTLKEFRADFKSKFKPGMTWENHGHNGWHIDHIRPISSFNFESYNDPEFKECWALENLQPLWAEENLSKGSKWEESVEASKNKRSI